MEQVKQEVEGENFRTPEEAFLDVPPTDDFNSPQYQSFLSSLFNFGAIPSKTFELSKNFRVKLRILSPIENVEILKKVDILPGNLSRVETLIIETLTRAIESINGQYLRFDDEMKNEWKQFRNTTVEPSTWEQQKYILSYRFQKPVLTEIFSKYQELLKEQEKLLEDLKKNSITD